MLLPTTARSKEIGQRHAMVNKTRVLAKCVSGARPRYALLATLNSYGRMYSE